MTFVLPFPVIDPILFEVGPLAIRWYSLAYIVGLLVAWRYIRVLARLPPPAAEARDIDDFLTWGVLAVVLGGRLGYVLFYQPAYFLDNPLAVLQVWKGGMSFHGGLLGVIVAEVWFVHRRGLRLLPFTDVVACGAPIGLFLGRLANFVNGELYGRLSDAPWAMVFPRGGPDPRHPSQLYEAGLEGVVLFAVMFVLSRRQGVRRREGLLSGVFLAGYAASRLLVELFRQPDAHIGFLGGGTTMGQWLSAPMLAAGLYLIARARRRPE